MNKEEYTGLIKITENDLPEVGDMFMIFTLSGVETHRVLVLDTPVKTKENRLRILGLALMCVDAPAHVGQIIQWSFHVNGCGSYHYFLPRYP